jgi:two-component sensor histidine kinase
VVARAPGADARQLYRDGGFAAALVRLDGATGGAQTDLAAMLALCDAAFAPPVIVIADEIPLGAATDAPSAPLEYVPAPFVSELLATRIACLVARGRLKSELARRDALVSDLEEKVGHATAAAAEERRASETLRERLSEQVHRSKNLLAIMQSIAQRTLSDGREISEARDVLLGRLRTLGRAHHLVSEAGGKGIALADVVEAELADVHHRVATSGPKVRLSASVVQTFALAIHELAVNAQKHGALGPDAEGSVAVGWTFFEYGADRYLEVDWTERGLVAPEAPPRYGFGLTLVASFAGGPGLTPNVTFDSNGLRCRMRLSEDVIVAG